MCGNAERVRGRGRVKRSRSGKVNVWLSPKPFVYATFLRATTKTNKERCFFVK